MNTKEFTKPENLEKYGFLWSEARLVIAAVALLLGGTPALYWLFGSIFYGLVGSVLTLSWLISGVVSGYLLWRWYESGQQVFGGKNIRDTAAFFVSVISGINLGLVGFTGKNIGMSIASGRLIFTLTALMYLVVAFYLWQRWNGHGKKLF